MRRVHRCVALSIAGTLLSYCVSAPAAESVTAPRPRPATRPEMKELLEDMKHRTPRIPLPEPTAEEQAEFESDARSRGYESRLRSHYLPEGETRGSLPFGGSPKGGFPGRIPTVNDPALTLTYRFKTQLFWIASRANNCQYCLGHQESKLLGAGMAEDEIAALDSSWDSYSEAEQAAFALARRLTLEPQKLSDADFDRVKQHYNDLQILEMVLSVAGNNSINRWKEGIGVPQSHDGGNLGRTGVAPVEGEKQTYLTPTSPKFRAVTSIVVPLVDETPPPQESFAEAMEQLAAAAQRKPRLPVVDEALARERLAEAAPSGPMPQWTRLLANFPIAGAKAAGTYRTLEEKGELSPLTKARLSWVIARHDRAWYALGDAQRRLRALGQTDEQIAALDAHSQELPAGDQALLVVARHLAASPVTLTDQQVAAAVKATSPRDVTQAIQYIGYRAAFDRFTEAARLPVEE